MAETAIPRKTCHEFHEFDEWFLLTDSLCRRFRGIRGIRGRFFQFGQMGSRETTCTTSSR